MRTANIQEEVWLLLDQNWSPWQMLIIPKKQNLLWNNAVSKLVWLKRLKISQVHLTKLIKKQEVKWPCDAFQYESFQKIFYLKTWNWETLIYKIWLFLAEISNLDSKVDTTKVNVEELKDKLGSSELKIEKLKRGHQEIKGNPMTSL